MIRGRRVAVGIIGGKRDFVLSAGADGSTAAGRALYQAAAQRQKKTAGAFLHRRR
jgi:hypothetical protein